MKWDEIIPDSAWVVENLLTPDECERFLSAAERAGIAESPSSGDSRYRDSVSVSVDDEEMADRVFERIRQHLPQEVRVDERCRNDGLRHSGKDLYGTWTPCGLNRTWRVACYPGRGHFGPHRDGCRTEDRHRRSLLTINGYLTDRPVGFGGATRFVRDDLAVYKDDRGLVTTPEEAVTHRVEADRAGKAVVFFHDLMHDGEPLREGSPPKWLFRTEVMYRRDPESAPQMTEDELKARSLMKEAEEAECNSELFVAMKLYSRAYKLDPTLEVP